MPYTSKELENLSKLFLSEQTTNVELAFELIRQHGPPPELINEFYWLYLNAHDPYYPYTPVEPLKTNLQLILQGLVKGKDERQLLLSDTAYYRSSGKYGATVVLKKVSKASCLDPLKIATFFYQKLQWAFNYVVKYGSSDFILQLLEERLTPEGDLDLAEEYLETLPQAIFKLKKLVSLNLRNNRIKELPESFAQLTDLTSLNLSSNLFKNFPSVITKLPKLKKLNIAHLGPRNKLIDESFFNLNGLTELVLAQDYEKGQTSWTDLPRISKVVGTNDDPIDLYEIALAKRAFEQRGEGSDYIVQNGYEEDLRWLCTRLVTDDKIIKNRPVNLGRLPEMIQEYDLREIRLQAGGLVTYDLWEALVKYTPNLEVLEFSTGMTYESSELLIPYRLSKLKKLRVLNFGDLYFEDYESIKHYTEIEELAFSFQQTLNGGHSAEDCLRPLEGLKKLRKLKSFSLTGISISHNSHKSLDEFCNRLRGLLFGWLPPNCKISVSATN